jgi:hypothetical protein
VFIYCCVRLRCFATQLHAARATCPLPHHAAPTPSSSSSTRCQGRKRLLLPRLRNGFRRRRSRQSPPSSRGPRVCSQRWLAWARAPPAPRHPTPDVSRMHAHMQQTSISGERGMSMAAVAVMAVRSMVVCNGSPHVLVATAERQSDSARCRRLACPAAAVAVALAAQLRNVLALCRRVTSSPDHL